MKRAKFEAAQAVNKRLETVQQGLDCLEKLKSFKDNHEHHTVQLHSFTPDLKGTSFGLAANILDKKDMAKVADLIGDILLTKKAELEKEFAEI